MNEIASKENILLVKKDLFLVKADMIKWMFIFWAGQVSVTLGLILVVVR
ncbi:MAG: hypothetical protein IH596_11185 [Bacteroidales bacterium]|nr:hypothetical protein [Bacteroidales bacterium]